MVNVCLISCKTRSRKCQEASLGSPFRRKYTAQSGKGVVRVTAVQFAIGKPANRPGSSVAPLAAFPPESPSSFRCPDLARKQFSPLYSASCPAMPSHWVLTSKPSPSLLHCLPIPSLLSSSCPPSAASKPGFSCTATIFISEMQLTLRSATLMSTEQQKADRLAQ